MAAPSEAQRSGPGDTWLAWGLRFSACCHADIVLSPGSRVI